MKHLLAIIFGVVSLGLAIALYVTNRNDNAQHDADVSSLNDFSNRLETATSAINERDGVMLILSNNVDGLQAAWGTLSNRLVQASSTADADGELVTNLGRQLAAVTSDLRTTNQVFTRQVMLLTNQVAGLSQQLALTQTNLMQTNLDLVQMGRDYVALENRFRIDVGERMVVERKFRNSAELKAQMQHLKKHPAGEVTESGILAGLDVEVRSNGVYHVIAPHGIYHVIAPN
jgi:hypothetical protein